MRERLAAAWRLLTREHGWSRVWVSLGMAITMAGGGLIYYTTQDGEPPAGTAHFWIDTTGGTCVRQNPADGYDNDGTECDSMGEAYTAATSGDTVRIKSGTYAGETLSGRSKTITYRVEESGSVALTSKLQLQDFSNGSFYGPFDLTNTGDPDYDLAAICSENVEFHTFEARLFWIFDGSASISIYDSEFGSYDATDGTGFGDSAIAGWNGGGASSCTLHGGDGWVYDVLIDGVYFHDVYYGAESTWDGAHPDCLESYGFVDGITVRNSKFERCGNTFIGFYTDNGDNLNMLIENNLMKNVADSFWAMQLVDKPGDCVDCKCQATFRYNTFDTASGGVDAPPFIRCTSYGGSQSVYGNIISQSPDPTGGVGCLAPSTWSYNAFETAPSGTCGSNSYVGTITFTDRPTSDTDPTYDYHLPSGSAALEAGHPSLFPTIDFEGTTRTSPPDAGYDER